MEFEKASVDLPNFFRPSNKKKSGTLKITFELPTQPATRFLKICEKQGINPDITVSKLIKRFVQNKK